MREAPPTEGKPWKVLVTEFLWESGSDREKLLRLCVRCKTFRATNTAPEWKYVYFSLYIRFPLVELQIRQYSDEIASMSATTATLPLLLHGVSPVVSAHTDSIPLGIIHSILPNCIPIFSFLLRCASTQSLLLHAGHGMKDNEGMTAVTLFPRWRWIAMLFYRRNGCDN